MQIGYQNYYFYQSFIYQGEHVRKLRRTQLSCDKIFVGLRPETQKTEKPISRGRTLFKSKSSSSIPKIEGSHRLQPQKLKISNSAFNTNQYYKKGHTQVSLKNPLDTNGTYKLFANRNLKMMTKNTIGNQKEFQKFSKKNSLKNERKNQFKDSYQNIQQNSYSYLPSVNPSNNKLSSKQKSDSVRPYKTIIKQQQSANSFSIKSNKSKKQQFSKNSIHSIKNHELSGMYYTENIQRSQKNKEKNQNLQPYHNQSAHIYFHDEPSEIKQKFAKDQSGLIESSDKNFNLLAQQQQKKDDYISEHFVNKQETIVTKKSVKKVVPKKEQHQISKLNQVSMVQSVQHGLQEKQILPMLNLNSLNNSKNSELEQDPAQGKRIFHRQSCKNLPLSSRQPSRRSMKQSLERLLPNSIEEVIERVEIHQYILALIIDFGEETAQIYADDKEKWEVLCFLLQKKYFYESSNIVKALKGGRNVFNLSSIEIPSQLLKEHLDNPKIKQLIKLQEEKNMFLFKKLRSFYDDIKLKYREERLVKLESPSDNFTPCIIEKLNQQLFQMYEELLTSRFSEGNQLQKKARIIQNIEMTFLLSELSGKKIKKIQFTDEIQDFEIYYQKHLPKIIETIEHFESLNIREA